MTDIDFPYSRSLAPLESLLAGVKRPGGFFLAHRDSEKAPGMFGTLLLQLPSPHSGGELRIRHGSRETSIDLSAIDCSELGFSAFYADCEHEVRPVESGHRVCLVFNLLRGAASDTPPASAPSHDIEVEQAARLIGAAFVAEDAPRKLAWLLAHRYSQAELGFAALRGVDAAVAGVLCRAAEAAACIAHLGVVHIEESGPAEVHYVPSPGRRSRDDFDFDFEDEDEDETCFFLAADFDKAGWQDGAAALIQACRRLRLPVALERSRWCWCTGSNCSTSGSNGCRLSSVCRPTRQHGYSILWS